VWRTKGGLDVTIRPIRPEDEPTLVRFHENVSERSIYLRYFRMLKLSQRIAHERLTRVCYIDYDREMALVVERVDPASGDREILGVGRLMRIHGLNAAEFAVLITDKYQHQGIGTELLRRLVQVGRDEKLSLDRRRHPSGESRHAGGLPPRRVPVRFPEKEEIVKAENQADVGRRLAAGDVRPVARHAGCDASILRISVTSCPPGGSTARGRRATSAPAGGHVTITSVSILDRIGELLRDGAGLRHALRFDLEHQHVVRRDLVHDPPPIARRTS
jgi:GNAT superfamily N-acetyltransferase